MADKTTDMTANEALDLLMSSSGVSHPDYAKALDIVKHDSALWGQYQEFLQNREKEELSLAQQFDNIVSLYETTKEKVQQYSDEYKVNIYGKRTRSERGNEDKSDTTPTTWQTLCDIVEIGAQDENGAPIVDEKGNRVVLSNKQKNEWMAHIFAVSKATVAAELIADKNFEKMSEEEGRRYFRERVDDTVIGNLATAIVASNVRATEGKEAEIGSPEFVEYVQRQAQDAKEEFGRILDTIALEDAQEAEKEKAEKDVVIRKEMKAKYEASKKERLKTTRFHINPDMIMIGTVKAGQLISKKTQEIREGMKRIELQAKKAVTQKGKEAFENMSKRMSDVTSFLTRKWKSLEEKVDELSKGRYSQKWKPIAQAVTKTFKESAKDNKLKIMTNVALGGLASVTIASGAAFAGTVVGCYGIYHAASAWVWPIVAEKRKVRRLARESGRTLDNKTAWALAARRATQTKETQNGKKYNPYVIQGTVNTILGVAGGIALGTVIEEMSGAGTAAEAVEAGKTAWRAMRVVTPAAAQMCDAGVTFLADPNDPATRLRAKEMAIGSVFTAGIGLGAMAIFSGGSTAEMADVNEALQNMSNVENVAQKMSVLTNINLGDTSRIALDNDTLSQAADSVRVAYNPDSIGGGYAAVDTFYVQEGDTLGLTENVDLTDQGAELTDQTGLGGDEGVANPDVQAETTEPLLFPKEWNEDMGISQRQYNTLVRTMEGTLVDAEGKNVTLDQAYMNLSDDVMKENFPDMTREQVLYKYNRLYAMMRRAKDMGDGTLRELKTERRFWQYNDEMTAMVNLLGCGEQVPEGTGEGLKDLFTNKFNDILSSGEGNNYNVGQSLAKGCEDDEGQWLKVVQDVKSETPKVTGEPIRPRVAEVPTKASSLPEVQAPVQPQNPTVIQTGVMQRVTTTGQSAHTGHGSIKQDDITDTRSGQNMLKNAGYSTDR